MSKFHSEQLECPNCKKMMSATMWDCIEVNDSEEDAKLKEEVKLGKVFKTVCPHCQMEFHLNYPTLYKDHQHRFMIYYAPSNTENNKVHLPETIEAGYTTRSLSSYYEWIEKILIFEQGFNDVIIELIKAMMLQQEKQLQTSKGVYFVAANEEKLSFQIVGEKPLYINYPRNAYEAMAQTLKIKPVEDFQVINLRTFSKYLPEKKG